MGVSTLNKPNKTDYSKHYFHNKCRFVGVEVLTAVLMKSTIFWDRILLATCFHAGFLPNLFLYPEDGGDVPPKRRLTLNGLHGGISQKIVLFKYKFLLTKRKEP
jgi:hypothetical protein